MAKKRPKMVYLLYFRKIGKEGIIPLGTFPGTDQGRIDAKKLARSLAMDAGKCSELGLFEDIDKHEVWTMRLKDQAGEGAPTWIVRTTPYYG